MKTINGLGPAFGLVAILTLGACAGSYPPPEAPYGAVDSRVNDYSRYGVVQSIELVRQEKSGIGLGTIAGAVVGGVVGNQIGGGRGNAAATVIGAAGGGYVGHQLENRQPGPDAYKITVRLEDGSYQSMLQSSNAGLRVGDRVRVGNGVMERY